MRKFTMKKRGSQANEHEKLEDEYDDAVEENTNNSSKKSKGKKKNKRHSRKSASNGTNDAVESEDQYEVEAILDEKFSKGVRYFLIKWKGYGSESNSWEPEDVVNSPELIHDFESRKSDDSGRKSKKRTSEVESKSKKAKTSDDGAPDAEYEVDRIIEVYHKKNGKREFLVHWKGYTSNENTWEPEENMSCPELIKKFMEKVDKARETDTRELRMNRKPTKPFTLSMVQSGRRLSRRNLGKQRAQYHDNE